MARAKPGRHRSGFWYDNLRILAIMGVIGGLLIGTLLALTVGPHAPRLGEESTGDPALIGDVRAVLASDRGLKTLSVGRIRGGQVSFAGLGAEGRTGARPADAVRAGLDHQGLHRDAARRRGATG